MPFGDLHGLMWVIIALGVACFSIGFAVAALLFQH